MNGHVCEWKWKGGCWLTGGEGFVDVVKEDTKTAGVTGEEAKNEPASYLQR